jgi:hypothetical protein
VIGTCRAMPDTGSGGVAYCAAVPEGTQLSLTTMLSTIPSCYLAQKAWVCEAGFAMPCEDIQARLMRTPQENDPGIGQHICGERDGYWYDNPCYRLWELGSWTDGLSVQVGGH